MKRIILLLIILMGLVFPWACSDNNSGTQPTNPTLGGGSSSPTPPSGGTPISGTLTPTPTFVNNYGASASPNGIYYDGAGTLSVMEGVPGITLLPSYSINTATGALSPSGSDAGFGGNQLALGVPTPNATPGPWTAPTTVTLTLPMAVAFSPASNPAGYPSGWWAILDSSPGGAASIYEGGSYQGNFVCPSWCPGYDAVLFSSPRAMVADSTGYFYVADTGNGYIDVMGLGDWKNGGVPCVAWVHRWNGSTSNFPFKKPVALAIDAQDNLFVGDAGYSPSVVSEFSNLGTYLEGQWQLRSGCVINGLAADSLTPEDIYVSDTANGGQVEEYQLTGFNSLSLVRSWGIPVGSVSANGHHEYLPFYPSCIALIQAGLAAVPPTQIVVGDVNNNLIQVFGP